MPVFNVTVCITKSVIVTVTADDENDAISCAEYQARVDFDASDFEFDADDESVCPAVITDLDACDNG